MANSIVLKAKAVSTLNEYVAFSVALALNDGTKDIAAKFSIESEAATLPMVGITEYGKLVGLFSGEDAPTITIKATASDGTVTTYTGAITQILLDINPGGALGG